MPILDYLAKAWPGIGVYVYSGAVLALVIVALWHGAWRLSTIEREQKEQKAMLASIAAKVNTIESEAEAEEKKQIVTTEALDRLEALVGRVHGAVLALPALLLGRPLPPPE